MGEPSTAARYGNNSHHISEDEVIEAPELARKGEQRLRVIVDGEPNFFSFRVPCDDGHGALVEFHILPVVSDFARHTLYAVTGNYTPSHDAVRSDQVQEAAQLVYDTYIHVSHLRLNSDMYCQTLPIRHRHQAANS
jgi:hypothetical protein